MIRVEKTSDGRGFKAGPFDSYNEAWAAAAGGLAGLGLAGDVVPDNPDLRSRAWICADAGEAVAWYCYVTTEPPVSRAAPAPEPEPAPAPAVPAFGDLTPAERRKAVAADVLARLEVTNYAAGSYLDTSLGTCVPTPAVRRVAGLGGDLGPHVDAMIPGCTVCLLGGTLLAEARLFDNVPTSAVLADDGESCVGASEITPLLTDVFDREQLGLMECAFELEAPRGAYFGADERRCEDAVCHGATAGADPTARVRLVMEAVIASPAGLYDPPPTDRRGLALSAYVRDMQMGSVRISEARRDKLRERRKVAADRG